METQTQTDTKDGSYLLSHTTISNEYDQYIIPSSCIIKIEPSSDENENCLIDGDSIQQIIVDDMDSSIMNQSSVTIRPTQLDAIVEDSNEENSDDLDETTQPVR